MAKNLYYAKSKISQSRFIYHAWDTETDGLCGPLLCITSYTEKDTETPSRYFDGPNAPAHFLDYCFSLAQWHKKEERNVWVSHNLSYDLRYIIAYVLEHNEDYWFEDMGLRTDTDFYVFGIIRKSDNAVIHFVDSLAVFPRSLKDFASQFAPDHLKKDGPNFEGGERFNPKNPLHIEYARGDAEALYYAINVYAKTIEQDYGVTLGYTAAGTSLKAWQATLQEDEKYFRQSRKPRDFIRRGYYGGIVFITDSNPVENAVTYDINSSYPAQMRKGVPSGKAARTHHYYNSLECPGFYECEVSAPHDLIVPILPYRNDKGILEWVRGGFTGVYSNLEIDFAREHGYIIKTGMGYVFDDLCFPFDAYVDQCESIRTGAKKTPRETVAKLMQNALYGKFGTKEERRVLFIPETDEDFTDATPLNPDDPDNPFWVRREDQSEDMLNKIEWAAWITSQARLALLRVVYAIGPSLCLYGDTDSLTMRPDADQSLIPCSNKYGDFKKEKVWEQFRAIAPKCYCGIIENRRTGKSKGQRSKRMTEAAWMELFKTGMVEIDSFQVPSIMQALKRGVEPAKELKKKSSDILNCSSYQQDDNGIIRPKIRRT